MASACVGNSRRVRRIRNLGQPLNGVRVEQKIDRQNTTHQGYLPVGSKIEAFCQTKRAARMEHEPCNNTERHPSPQEPSKDLRLHHFRAVCQSEQRVDGNAWPKKSRLAGVQPYHR